MNYKFLLVLFISTIILTGCKLQLVKTYYDNKQLESKYKQHRKSEEKQGRYRIYHENGELALQMFYKNGKLQGEVKSYHQNGALESIATTIADSYEGNFKNWFATGTLQQEGTYINNHIEGNLKTYYPNGTLKEVVFFSKSVEDGPYILYHQNGKVKEEGYFLKGPYPNGLIKQYDGEGVLIRKMNCDAGACETTWELHPSKEKKIDK